MNNFHKFIIFTIAFLMAFVILFVTIRDTVKALKSTAFNLVKVENQIKHINQSKGSTKKTASSENDSIDFSSYVSGFLKFLENEGCNVKFYKTMGTDKNVYLETELNVDYGSFNGLMKSFGNSVYLKHIRNVLITADEKFIKIVLKFQKDRENFFNYIPNVEFSKVFKYRENHNQIRKNDEQKSTKNEPPKIKETFKEYGDCIGKISMSENDLYYVVLKNQNVITLSSKEIIDDKEDIIEFMNGNTFYTIKK